MATPIPSNRAYFTLAELTEAVSGRLIGPTGGAVSAVVTDSRRATPGCLFVALRGEHHDAHRFLPEAAAAGAAAALVEPGQAAPAPMVSIEVPDTLFALGQLAAYHRRRWGGRVVAITGSAGKTTTKELTAAALSAAGRRVTRTAGNLNNLIGVPMTLFTLGADSDTAVVEIGTSAPGEIARLTEIAAPQVGVVTTVAIAHAEGLGSLSQVADEKVSLLAGLAPDGMAVFGADSEILFARAHAVAPAFGFSFGRAAHARARLLGQTLAADLTNHCHYRIGEQHCDVRLRMIGSGPAVDAAAALAVVSAECGPAALKAACRGLFDVAPVPGRLQARSGPAGSLVIDDSYNANPASVAASLEALAQVARVRGGRAVAVLGDMKELGPQSAAQHRAIGPLAARLGVSELLLVGAEMALSGQASSLPYACVDDAMDALPLLSGRLTAADCVLVKGSRSMAMERLANALAGDGAAAQCPDAAAEREVTA